VPDETPVIELLPFLPAAPGVYSEPSARVRVISGLCEELGLHGELAASRALLERAEQTETAARTQVTAASGRFGQAYEGFLRGTVDVDGLAAELAADGVWLDHDVPGGRPSVMMAALMRAAADMRTRAGAVLEAESATLYRKLQRVAGDVVRTAAEQPPLPASVWSATDPALAAARAGSESTWGVLVREADRWATVHRAGEMLRAGGGLGAEAHLSIPAPEGIAFVWRRWWLAVEGLQEARRLPGPLRLVHGIQQQWDPGLWLRSDIPDAPPETAPERGIRDRLLGWVSR
jgi:hypothetical protein